MLSNVILNREWGERAFGSGSAELPFSFVYNGRHSSEFISTWKRAVRKKRLAAGRLQRTLTLTDEETGLEVSAVATIYTDTPGVDWTLHFTNRGNLNTPIIEKVNAIDLVVAARSQSRPVFHGIHGCYPHSWLPFDRPLSPGEVIEFGAVDGLSSTEHSPFFNIGLNDGGVIVAIGWSGQWKGSIECDKEDALVRIKAGMEFLHLLLRPGETIRSPRILLLHYIGSEAFSYNLFRKTMFKHIMPKARGKVTIPPISHLTTTFYELNCTDESSVLSHLEAIKGLGFEVFWLDAFFTRGGFPDGMGNYGFPPETIIPDPVRFPHGLKPVAEAVRKAGLKFLMWFEPERVAPETHIATKHPEFVISPDGDGSGLLDLGNPEAREYMTKTLDEAVKCYHLDWIRFDYNHYQLTYWQYENAKDPDRVGMAEIRFVEGLYRMWDDLLALNPGLRIDNCSGGGRRIDLETCSRSLPLWRTDSTIPLLFAGDYNQAALLNQVMTAGLSRYVPFSISGQSGATPYEFRSGVNGGGISFCEDVRPNSYPREAVRKGQEEAGLGILEYRYGPNGYPLQMLKQGIVEAKRVRKYYFGDCYALSRVTADDRDWCVLQYHRPKQQDGMIVAFRRPGSTVENFACTGLREIKPAAAYWVRQSQKYRPEKPAIMTGADLMRLSLDVKERPGSVIVEYRRIAGQN